MNKKLVFLASIALALALAAPALAYSPSSGDLTKVVNNPAIYYIDAGGNRHLFSTESTFFSWYTGSWKDQAITTISEYDLNRLPISHNITARPGFALLRFNNSLKMYAVLPSGQLCYASSHYDNYQYNRALVIPAAFESDYINSGTCDITSNKNLPDGSLIRYNDSSDIYYIQNGQRRLINSNGFSQNNFKSESIINGVDGSMSYPEGPTIAGQENPLVDPTYELSYTTNNNYNYNTCTENWSCGSWGSCQGSGSTGNQYRNCYDRNYCGTYGSQPATSQTCNLCAENWSCTAWTICASGRQTRQCQDVNRCGTSGSKPTLSQTCY